jgi:glutamine amidotransferase
MVKIAIIDYKMGNLGSVKRKFDLIGASAEIVSDYQDLNSFDKFILPGVGHFAMGAHNLRQNYLWEELNEQVLGKEKQILGICLGMQLMAKHSEEGDIDGLGWFDADITKFVVSDKIKFKVPHMGWNTLSLKHDHPIMQGINDEDEFYFVHSYHCVMQDQTTILANTVYDYEFTSAIFKNNIFGFQFHPEKSLETGKKLLKNFIDL